MKHQPTSPPAHQRSSAYHTTLEALLRFAFVSSLFVSFGTATTAQDIVINNETNCDLEVKVTYGNTSSCTTVYTAYCPSTTTTIPCNTCPDGCDCAIPGTYSCGATSYSLLYSAPANSQVQFTPPTTVCCIYVLDTNPVQSVLFQCCCHQCECYTQLTACFTPIEIEITPGWTVRMSEL